MTSAGGTNLTFTHWRIPSADATAPHQNGPPSRGPPAPPWRQCGTSWRQSVTSLFLELYWRPSWIWGCDQAKLEQYRLLRVLWFDGVWCVKVRVCQLFEVCHGEFDNLSLPCEGRLKEPRLGFMCHHSIVRLSWAESSYNQNVSMILKKIFEWSCKDPPSIKIFKVRISQDSWRSVRFLRRSWQEL